MARDWLANQRLYRIRPGDPSLPEGYSLDLDDRVLELMITGLDPERGWQLLLTLLRLAEDEGDVTQVAIRAPESFASEHHDEFLVRARDELALNPRFAEALSYTMAGWPGLDVER